MSPAAGHPFQKPDGQSNRAESKSRAGIDDAINRGLSFILTNQKSGAAPYKPGQSPSTEATAFCGIAARNEYQTSRETIKFLLDTQHQNGGWSTAPDAGKSDWTSSLGLLALRLLSDRHKIELGAGAPEQEGGGALKQAPIRGPSSRDFSPSDIRRAENKAFEYLFDSRTEFYRPIGRLLLLLFKGESALHYARGWPWTVGCYHWVEPTSYAILSFMLPRPPETEVYRTAVSFASQFLKENACKAGGWNHGNSMSLGAYQPPYVVTTAEALIAMQKYKDHSTVEPALNYLKSERDKGTHSCMSLAWTMIARLIYDLPIDLEVERLKAKQNDDGSFGPNLMVTGLSLIALQAAQGDNVFKFNRTG